MALEIIAKDEAEKLAGIKLDGRKKYFIWDGIVCYKERYKHACSGCSDDSEYSSAAKGFGCSECGYSGVRWSSFPCPANIKQVT